MNTVSREKGSLFLLGMTAFVLPLSTAMTFFCFMLTSLFALVMYKPRAFVSVINHPVILICLSFLVFQCLTLFYSTATLEDAGLALKRVAKFLYLPFLLILFRQPKARQIGVLAFILGTTVTMMFGVIKFFSGFHFWRAAHYSGIAVFKDHIQTSSLMAFAAFLCVTLAPYAPKWKRGLYGLAFLMGLFIFFLNMGRSGYVLFILLALLWGYQRFQIKGMVMAAGLCCALLGGAYWSGAGLRARVQAVGNEVMQFQQGDPDSSSGQRMGFNLNSLVLFKEHPVFGFGMGSFPGEYAKRFGETGPLATRNPHNQYTLFGVEFGMVGIVWFLSVLGMAFYYSLRLPAWERPVLQAITLMIGVGSFVNSWLSDTTETHLFIYFVALSLGAFFKDENRAH